jgi:hypothetical protein
MNVAYIFNMIDRTVGTPLPDCIVFPFEDGKGYKIEFYGEFDELCAIPLRLDLIINENTLVGDARQSEIRKNGTAHVAEYWAYAVHVFEDSVPI